MNPANSAHVPGWPAFSLAANNAATIVYTTTWTNPSDNGGAAGACVPCVPLWPSNHGGAALAIPWMPEVPAS